MARSLRISASAVALVLSMVSGPAIAQNLGDEQISVPFSSLSAAAQQEIIALQRQLNHESAPAPVFQPLERPVSRTVATPVHSAPALLDDRRARVNWAIGVYR
jgi:hypothetical protein